MKPVAVSTSIRSGLDTVGEGEGIVAWDEMPRRHQLGLQARRQRIGTEIDHARQFIELDPPLAAARVHHRVARDVEIAGARLQDRRRDGKDIVAQNLGRLQRGLAADAGAARGPGAAAIGRGVGVAEHDANPVHRDAEHAADDLGRQRFRSLALFGDAGMRDHRPARIEPHGDAVLRRNARAADAIEGGARISDLDEARQPDAAMDALLPQAGPAPRANLHSPSWRGDGRARHDATRPRSAGPTATPQG